MVRFFGKLMAFVVGVFVLFTVQGFAGEEGGSIQSVIGVDYIPHVSWSFPSMFNPHGTDEMNYEMEEIGRAHV
jgi:hypothetical protein